MTAEGAHARALEAHTRRLLAEHATQVVPGDGLPLIRARIARRPWWRRVWDLLTVHRHVYKLRPEWLDIEDVRCRICGERPCKNAAPVSAGAAPNPTAVKEPKDMSHDFIEESTPRGRQMAAALALAKLVERGPDEVAEWRIDDLGRLHGHVRRAHSDEQAREAVAAFALFLCTKVVRSQGRNDRSEWLHLSAAGTYRGTAVNVWTHVDIRPVSPYASFGGAQ